MAKISNTTIYPTKGSPAGTDYVIGTDASSQETKTFTLQSIADLYAGSGSGTVTSVGLSAGTTGLTITSDTANPITTTGTFTLGGVLATANGGTGLSALGTRSQSLRINAAADGLEYVDSNVVEIVRNNTSNPILKGQPLKVVGEVAGVVSVEVAQADSSSNMPCIGLAAEDIAATSNGLMIQVGMLKEVNINTIQGAGSAAVGDIVYVSAAAAPGTLLLTRDKPLLTALIQNIGIITKTGANGDIQVTATGRTNDLPNLPQGNIWLGDSNGVPSNLTIGANNTVLTSNGTTASWQTPSGSGGVSGYSPFEIYSGENRQAGTFSVFTQAVADATITGINKAKVYISSAGVGRTIAVAVYSGVLAGSGTGGLLLGSGSISSTLAGINTITLTSFNLSVGDNIVIYVSTDGAQPLGKTVTLDEDSLSVSNTSYLAQPDEDLEIALTGADIGGDALKRVCVHFYAG